MTRSRAFRYLLLVAFSFLLGFSYDYHLPKIESFLLVEIEHLSQGHSPVRIWADRLHFHLFPLGVVLDNVRLLPEKPYDRYLAPALLKEAGAHLALWPLLRGELRLSQVYVRDSELNVFLRQELFQSSKKSARLKIDFDQLYRLPIDELQLENVRIQGKIEPKDVVFRVNDLSLLVENRYQSIFVEVEAPHVQVKPSGPVDPLNVQLELRTLVEAQEMQVSAFKLKADDSFVVASGRFNGDFTVGRIDNGAFDARTKLKLSDLNLWEGIFSLAPELPRLMGKAEVDLGVEVRQGKGYKLEADVQTEQVQVGKYTVGEMKGHLRSDLKSVTSDLISASNSAGHAFLKNLVLTLGPAPALAADVSVKDIEVHELLENLDVKHVPIQVSALGEAHCQGPLGAAPELVCQGEISAPKVHVDSGKPKFTTIVEVNNAKTHGQIKITKTQVEYKADLNLGANSSGHSDGVINYEDGFKINYQGDKLDFHDVANVANLKLEGVAKITGNTIGTSHTATVDMNVDGKDLWLEDYPLGQMTGKLSYRAGTLDFANLTGQYGVSRYNGQVLLNLHEKHIKIVGQIPFMDLKDVQSLFARKVELPIQISGTGQGKIEAEGPLRFQDLSYTLNSSFFRGQIANETYDDLTFRVRSKNGFVKSEKIVLNKSSGQVDLKGQITPTGQIDCVAIARGLRLEQSENALALGLDLQGLADFTVLVRGQLPRPRVELNGKFSKVVLGDQTAEDSVFKLNFLPDRVEGSGQFLGSTLSTEAVIPYDSQAPFLFKLKTRKWDFTTLFSMISRTARQVDFNTSVSMDVALSSANGGFWNSSGKVQVNEFSIRKTGKTMQAEKPMILNFNKGVINSENFVANSGDSFLKLNVAGMTRSNFNASLNGKLDLSILGVFTPFIADLRGNMALSMDLKGTFDRPLLSGSAYVDKAYVKLADFFHPFSNVRADLLFNDNQILINTLRSDLAGGKLNGDGKITFSGKGNRPIDIKGSFNDVKLNVPEGFHSEGSGTVAMHGKNFPYALDISYIVSGGEIVKELSGGSNGTATVKASAFLPRFLEQPSFNPFNFGIDVDIKGPTTINNALVQTPIEGSVRISGNPDRLALNGTLTAAPGGKVFFRDQPFEISSAYVEYTGQGPTEPKIYVTANTHVIENVVDEQNRATQNQYEVSLLVQGKGPTPQISLTSQPPLGQREIVSLLALGMTGAQPNADERRTSIYDSANTSAAIGSVVLDKAGAKRVKEALGVDVKVSTAPPIGDNASAAKVTLSKQWTPNLGASASSTVESDPNNNVKLEYKMNRNVSVIGSWDGRETLHDQQEKATRNVLGLDLQYKMQFK